MAQKRTTTNSNHSHVAYISEDSGGIIPASDRHPGLTLIPGVPVPIVEDNVGVRDGQVARYLARRLVEERICRYSDAYGRHVADETEGALPPAPTEAPNDGNGFLLDSGQVQTEAVETARAEPATPPVAPKAD